MRGTGTPVEKEEPEFKVDLRIEGSAQDVILKDEERTDQLEKVVDKLRTGYHTKSRVVQFTTWATFSCTSWTDIQNRAVPILLEACNGGLIFCSCGICLRPDEEQIQRIKARFEAMLVLYCFA